MKLHGACRLRRKFLDGNQYSRDSRQVFLEVEYTILSGRRFWRDIIENEELKENAIAAERVNRTPVEALRQLELEGLVNIIPNKAYVTGITRRTFMIYIPALILKVCAKWACENITNAQIEELEEMYIYRFSCKKKPL